MVYYLTSGVFCYAKRSTKQTIYARIQKMNSTPFVRQYDILSNKWGAVQQKTLRGFYYVVGVDACIDPRGAEDAAPLQPQTSERFSRLSSCMVSTAARTIFTASPGR